MGREELGGPVKDRSYCGKLEEGTEDLGHGLFTG